MRFLYPECDPQVMSETQTPTAFVCGYSEDGDGGIFRYRLDEETGKLAEAGLYPAQAAAFAAIHPDGAHLYTANRVSGGAVTAYEFNPDTGDIAQVGRTHSGATDPCYVSVDAAGRYVFVSNYADGTVAAIPLETDGGFGSGATVVDHEGSSIHPERQQEPHPHSIVPGPKNRYIYVPDLGSDRIVIYEFDPDGAVLRPTEQRYVPLHEGAGPRHFVFHPDSEVCYVINELDSTITAFRYEPDTGDLSEMETVSTLSEEYDGENICADIHVHPSGEWLYGSNRGHDSIVIFSIDDSGRLRFIGHESTRGHWPRNFALDPSGNHLHVENRRSDSIVSFRVDDASGRLTPIGQELSLPEPICMVFRSGP